jgi:erythrocyte band 7 integral membrane protein
VTSVTKINNVYSATQLLAQTTLRNMLGTKTLQDILSDREAIANQMEAQLDEGSSPWGIKVERVEMYADLETFFFVEENNPHLFDF